MIDLRAATQADIPVIVAISNSAYWSNIDQFEPGASQSSRYRDLVRDMHRREASAFWQDIMIARIDDCPVGWGARFSETSEISEMWVRAEHQGRGAGTALLGRFLADIAAEGHGEAWIETHERNHGAIGLYQRMGFVPDHVFARYSEGLERDIPLVRMRCLLR